MVDYLEIYETLNPLRGKTLTEIKTEIDGDRSFKNRILGANKLEIYLYLQMMVSSGYAKTRARKTNDLIFNIKTEYIKTDKKLELSEVVNLEGLPV